MIRNISQTLKEKYYMTTPAEYEVELKETEYGLERWRGSEECILIIKWTQI